MRPAWAAGVLARRRFAGVGRDRDNFTHPDEIANIAAGFEVVSFDLFDTVITRTVPLQQVHARTAEFADRMLRGDDGPLPKGLLGHSRHRFQEVVKARGMADEAAYRDEVDLADVFDGALAPYLRDPERRAQAVAAAIAYELETEKRVLRVDPAMRRALEDLRRTGKRVILITDMYFAEQHVHELLAALGLDALFDEVFVSASVGVTKHGGRMFAHVDEALGLADRRRIHFGDNWNNDVVQPKQAGWEARHYFRRENEEAKAALEIEARLDPPGGKRAFRRLSAELLPGGADDTLTLTAAAFSVFAERALQTAIAGGYDRMLFLTRDGTVFRALLDEAIAATGAGAVMALPEMDELAFSRRAGVVLGYPGIEDPSWHSYLAGNVGWLSQAAPTLVTLLRTFAIEPAALGLVANAEAKAEAERLMLKKEPVGALWPDDIAAHPKLLAAIDSALKAQQAQITAYFDQLGLFDRDEKILLVDIGYSGTAAKALSEYMVQREDQGLPVRSRLAMVLLATNRYFLGNQPLMHPRVSLLDGALIDRQQAAHRAVAANFAWLEPFAVDRTRGSLRGYEAGEDGRIVPVFAPPGDDAEEADAARARLIAAAKAWEASRRVASAPLDQLDRDLAAAFIRHFLRAPQSAVAALRKLTHHGGLAEVSQSNVVMHLRPLRLLGDLRTCNRSDRWIQGSLRASRLGFLVPAFNWVVGKVTQ